MAEKHLHIICLDVPYPVDYGGVFDLFYKIKALYEAGVSIHLHCFEYGRVKQKELNKYCSEVIYYQRIKNFTSFINLTPYMVASRGNSQLLDRLNRDNYPILMEGIHCTYFLQKGSISQKRCFVRLHNVEYQYYKHLASTSFAFGKKLYYQLESYLLKKYELKLAAKAKCFTVSENDLEVFKNELGYKMVEYLPLFLPEYVSEWQGDRGQYCLYQGNLSVAENEFAAFWLIENVFQKLDIPFVIAGKNPSERLKKHAEKHQHICLVANPGEDEMAELLKKAHVNILPSFNRTGIKLKLINALFNSRHCLVNNAGVDGAILAGCCQIANTAQEMKNAVAECWSMPFTIEQHQLRIEKLQHLFDNKLNAKKLISKIL